MIAILIMRLPPDNNYEKVKKIKNDVIQLLRFEFHLVGQCPVRGSALNLFHISYLRDLHSRGPQLTTSRELNLCKFYGY